MNDLTDFKTKLLKTLHKYLSRSMFTHVNERSNVNKRLFTYLCAFFHVVFPLFVLQQTNIIHILVEHVLTRRHWFHPRHGVSKLWIATVNLTECELNVKMCPMSKRCLFWAFDRILKAHWHPRGHVTDVIRTHRKLFSSSGRFWAYVLVISPPAGLPLQRRSLFNL